MTLHDADVLKRLVHSGVSLFRKRTLNIYLIVLKIKKVVESWLHSDEYLS